LFGLTAFGDFNGTFELIDHQNNSLQSGDEIELRFISQNGHFIASGLFLYGDDNFSCTMGIYHIQGHCTIE
jgi:hypothetical protein